MGNGYGKVSVASIRCKLLNGSHVDAAHYVYIYRPCYWENKLKMWTEKIEVYCRKKITLWESNLVIKYYLKKQNKAKNVSSEAPSFLTEKRKMNEIQFILRLQYLWRRVCLLLETLDLFYEYFNGNTPTFQHFRFVFPNSFYFPLTNDLCSKRYTAFIYFGSTPTF